MYIKQKENGAGTGVASLYGRVLLWTSYHYQSGPKALRKQV